MFELVGGFITGIFLVIAMITAIFLVPYLILKAMTPAADDHEKLTEGQYAHREDLLKRALVTDKEALGPDHPGVALSLNNLAVLYDTRRNYAHAEPLYKRALEIDENALGPDHPRVAVSLENLASLYRATERHEEAETLEERAARIRAIQQ